MSHYNTIPTPIKVAIMLCLALESSNPETAWGASTGQTRKPLPPPAEIAKLPPDGGAEFNRLIHETSPYLLQHARNPVDWYPWGEEAFKRAAREDKPVFLSVGYSSCHWCHVMEHESFENEEVADLINKHFIPVKVDREERPDIDEIYMNATQLMTGRGGWPNSIWLTPDKRPWYTGTYFPREAFMQLLNSLDNAWLTRRQEIEAQADKLAGAIKTSEEGAPDGGAAPLSDTPVKKAMDNLRLSFDSTLGGFGGAPQFPPHGSLRLLLHVYERTQDDALLNMATRTLDAMALGGIHDHIGGGFHRYSTDKRWFLPHFEKMLYDNGQLAWVYTEAYRLTGNDLYRVTVERMFDWVFTQMTDSQGGFYSALDADSEGVEGKYYLWPHEEVMEILGPEEGALFCRVYTISPKGNYYEEATGKREPINIAHLKKDLGAIAKDEKISVDALKGRLDTGRKTLLNRRMKRIPPQLDDKILTSWNGLMIAGLAYAGRHLENPRYTQSAEKAADFILQKMKREGRLYRSYRAGQARLNAYSDDYAFLADGLLDLYETTRNKKWLTEAVALMETLTQYYKDSERGGFYFTAHDHEDLLIRSKDPFDRAIPSGNAMATRVFTRLGILTGNGVYLDTARELFQAFNAYIHASPRASATFLDAMLTYLDRDKTNTQQAVVEVRKDPVTIKLFAPSLNVNPGASIELETHIVIDEKWHLNSNQPKQDYLIPTQITLAETPFAQLGKIAYPEGHIMKVPAFPEDVSIYEGTVKITVPLSIHEKAAKRKVDLVFKVQTQACDDKRCLPPETHRLTVPIKVE